MFCVLLKISANNLIFKIKFNVPTAERSILGWYVNVNAKSTN
jgi:hypothetical protein